MKRFITILIISLAATKAMAQYGSTASASQATQFSLSDVIEIVFTETGTEVGAPVLMPFNSANDFKKGVTVADQELRVRANTNFKVSLKCDMSTFSYTGNEAVKANLEDALGVMVTSNGTGGQVAAPYNNANFAPIASEDQNLLVNGLSGGNQRFAVKYQCKPKHVLPVGDYYINVVFTATKN